MTDSEFLKLERGVRKTWRKRAEDRGVGPSYMLGMDRSTFSCLKKLMFLDCFFDLFRPQWTMAGLLWRTGVLLCFLSFCACVEEECVRGVVGRPVSLPCFYPKLLRVENFSIEWRRNDDVVVVRSVFENKRNVEELSLKSATISVDAELTGNFSLELPTVHPKEDQMNYSLFIISEKNQSAALCTVCLRIAASFSTPLLQREEAAQGGETTLFCHSSGGFPEPTVLWLINNTKEPPEGSVRTLAASLPDSHLYNITSHLRVNISKDSSVSCTIENLSMNETLTSTSYGVQKSPVVSRASEAMWIFSTALSVVVGVLVVVGVAYQIHLDRISKRKKREHQHANRGYKRRSPYKEDTEETEVVKLKAKETDV